MTFLFEWNEVSQLFMFFRIEIPKASAAAGSASKISPVDQKLQLSALALHTEIPSCAQSFPQVWVTEG
ncbi:MAG: hypothetical protein L0G59_03050 [Kocuria sp.]|nr:hypothetical protein [Kocuria sp.]